MSDTRNPAAFPKPHKRRTHGAFYTADEAMAAGHGLVRLMNGIPFGFHLAIFRRLGAYVLVSYPRGEG
jgi:hypothetical protein